MLIPAPADPGDSMVSIRGVYEIAIRVRDLPRAEAFYTGVLGLTPALRDERLALLALVGDRG